MAIKYRIYEDIKLVYTKSDGILRGEDLMKHMDELANDPGYIPPMKKIVDYSDLEKYDVTTKDSREFSLKKQSLADRFINEQCAYVVPSDLVYGMARHHQAFLDEEKLKTKIFRNIDEAKQWLEIALDYKLSIV